MPDAPWSAAVVAQSEADNIKDNVRGMHMPAPLQIVVDPRFLSGTPGDPNFNALEYYMHTGDAAIWTGHYLAAEAFRYAATQGNPDAFEGVTMALAGIATLADVTASTRPGLLARFYMPKGWTYEQGVFNHERADAFFSGTIGGQDYWWMGNTSRDQYSGVFFGLGVAYDLVPVQSVRDEIRRIVKQLLSHLLANSWNVINPNGKTSTTFAGRADQQLSFLQVGRRVDPATFDATYKSYRSKSASSVGTPIAIECLDTHGSYYKFNLNHINLYNLIRLEEAGSARTSYLNAYNRLRGCTGSHQNAHFNMVDRGVKGTADATRDGNTRQYLELWLTRPRRNFEVNLRGQFAACGTDRACSPIPVDKRINTDFVWQRSPFSLYGAGDGRIETAALDYFLPYWMGRYYGVITQ
ncbi:MAG: hypothetical protein ABR499_11000 [Gemmatimonadaceae bacterium]